MKVSRTSFQLQLDFPSLLLLPAKPCNFVMGKWFINFSACSRLFSLFHMILKQQLNRLGEASYLESSFIQGFMAWKRLKLPEEVVKVLRSTSSHKWTLNTSQTFNSFQLKKKTKFEKFSYWFPLTITMKVKVSPKTFA